MSAAIDLLDELVDYEAFQQWRHRDDATLVHGHGDECPACAEQRREPRRVADIDIVLAPVGLATPAKIVNISRGGAGLATSTQLMLGSRVALRGAGSTLQFGTVKWSTATAAGIAFDAPLEPDDPWLSTTTK
jgi:hypothetical protein